MPRPAPGHSGIADYVTPSGPHIDVLSYTSINKEKLRRKCIEYVDSILFTTVIGYSFKSQQELTIVDHCFGSFMPAGIQQEKDTDVNTLWTKTTTSIV